jgi:hypothetical protein
MENFKIGETFFYDIESEPQIVVKIQNKLRGVKLITSKYVNQDYSKLYNRFHLHSQYSLDCVKERIVEYENGIPTNWEI